MSSGLSLVFSTRLTVGSSSQMMILALPRIEVPVALRAIVFLLLIEPLGCCTAPFEAKMGMH
jgi:hypothetical protein